MCLQPPISSTINTCLTPQVISTYFTFAFTTIVGVFLVFIILRASRKTSAHYYLSLYIMGTIFMLPVIGGLAVLAGNPKLALLVYQIGSISIICFDAFYWFVRAFLKLKEKWIFLLSIIFPLIIGIVLIFNPNFLIKGVHWDTRLGYYALEFNLKGAIISYSLIIFWFLGSWKLFQASRKTRSAMERNRLKYLAISPLILLFGLILISIPATHIFPFDMIGAILSASLLTYAVFRYNLLDLNIVVRKGLLYSVLTITVTGIYLFLSLLLHFIFQKYETPISLISTALIIALIFQPLQANTQRFIDKVFFRRKYDPQKLVANLSEVFSKSLDLNFLASELVNQICDTMQIEKALLLFSDKKTGNLRILKVRGIGDKSLDFTIASNSPFAQFIAKSQGPQVNEILKEKNIPFEPLDTLGLELFVPLESRGQLIGIFALGPKLSKEYYSLEEFKLFEIIANSTTLALENASLFTEVQESKNALEIKVRARTRELEGLTENLDEQVKERTKELQEKISELEKFYKLTVGRELKMKELKEKLKKSE